MSTRCTLCTSLQVAAWTNSPPRVVLELLTEAFQHSCGQWVHHSTLIQRQFTMQRLNLLDSLNSFHSLIRLIHSIRLTPSFECFVLLDSFPHSHSTCSSWVSRLDSIPALSVLFSRLRHEAATGTSAFLLSKAQRLRLSQRVLRVSVLELLCTPCCCDLLQFVPSRDECVYLFSRVRCRKQLACANGRVDGARFSTTTPYTAILGRCLLLSLRSTRVPRSTSWRVVFNVGNAAYECAVAMCAVARRKWSHCASLAAKNESDLCLNEICLHNVQVKRT